MALLREQLLEGRSIALAGGVEPTLLESLAGLGARTEPFEPDVEQAVAPDAVGSWARSRAPLDVLVYDASGAFVGGGAQRLRTALEHAWAAIREIATGELIPTGRGGKIVLIAPRHGADALAEPTRAALENLARTLSVEWARHHIAVTMIAPGARTTDAELASLVSYLLSPAGDYFSGCRLSLGETQGSPR
jgi:NAD(P)-dependent dehydrogenase (short-subunit alcohol dehydrogenase family)